MTWFPFKILWTTWEPSFIHRFISFRSTMYEFVCMFFFYSFIDFNVVVLYSYQVYCVLANWMHSSIVQKHIWIVNRQMWKELKLNCTLVFHSCIHSILVHIHFALCVPLQLPYSYACGKLFFRNLFTVIVRTGEVRKLLSIHLIDKVLYTFRIFSLIRSIEMRIAFATS